MILHKALRHLRVFHNVKHSTLAYRLRISTTHLSTLESGMKNPSIKILKLYSEIFQIPISSIFFIAENLEQYEHGKGDKVKIKLPEKVKSLFIAVSLNYL